MKCPACSNTLSEWLVGTIAVDVCDGGCAGIWFDAFELQKAGKAGRTVGDKLAQVWRNPDVIVDFGRKRECPRCDGVKLTRTFFSPSRRVQVDHCPSCGGYWLDAGELATIREETARVEVNAPHDEQGMSMEMIRFLYRLQTSQQPDSTPPLQ